MNSSADVLRSSQRLYARIWRWHFFAALIVIPFVLWQGLTGVTYLWHHELAGFIYPDLLHVEPQAVRVSYEQQLQSVLARRLHQQLQSIEITDDPTRSSAFFFADENGLPSPAFVNPYTGEYLGHVEATQWVRGLSKGLHGGWPIDPWGSYLLELGACWAIVMTLTGLYLWWPRSAKGLAGVLYPRLRSGKRIFWRDLHAVVGVYFAVIMLAFLFSALPWTSFWGERVLGPIERATHQSSPLGFFFAGHHDRGAHTEHAARERVLSLDEIVEHARAAGATGDIEIKPQAGAGPVNLRTDRPRASEEIWLQLDAHDGAVVIRATWKDYPPLAKAIALGIDLHEGHWFGRINQIFNTLLVGALIWLCVTGFIGWYKRRPSGQLAAPPKRELVFPRAVIATGVALCLVMPLLALSVIAIEILDRVVGRVFTQPS
jgi:uncharacterized iron-regulated membrane protein